MDGSLMLPTRYYSDSALQVKCPDLDWKLPAALTTKQGLSCPSPRAAILADTAKFNVSLGREVIFAKDLSDYFVLPDIGALPGSNPTASDNTVTTPSLPLNSGAIARVVRGYSRYIVAASGGTDITINVSVPHTTVPMTLQVTDAAGNIKATAPLANSQAGTVAMPTQLGVLAAGNYLVEVFPGDKNYSYALWTSVTNGSTGVPYAFEGGTYSVTSKQNFYFYVPAEVDYVLLTGVDLLYNVNTVRNGALGDVIYECGSSCSAQKNAAASSTDWPRLERQDLSQTTGPFTWKLKTAGLPAIWHVVMQSKKGAHLVNLPDVMSNYSNAVISSKRIRTATLPAVAGAATTPVTSPNLKYNNRFIIKLPAAVTAGQTLVSMGSGTSLASPPSIIVQLLTPDGAQLSSTSIVPGAGTVNITSPSSLAAGDYELRVTNPSIYNAYAIIVPAGTSFASVDGYALGNVNASSYRAFFTLPAHTQYVQLIAKPTGTPVTVYSYDQAGEHNRGPAASKGNNVYQFQTAATPSETSPTDTLWAVNLKGDYWSDIRLLDAPQIMSFNKNLHLLMAPSN
jgi:hypothetical protein